MVYVAPTMVAAIANPALDAFVAEIQLELLFGEVVLRRKEAGFELTHVSDENVASLREVSITELRQIAQLTAQGEFRPLKSAPTLQRGWRFVAATPLELERALQILYPGAVADWFAARQPNPPITHYRSFTSRQTGMYRIANLLSDTEAATVIGAGCHRRFCLKQRLWTVEGLAPDRGEAKSLIPCLEPCAVLLEFARTTARVEQRPQGALRLAAEDLETVIGAVERLLEKPARVREADFSAGDNPRRLQWIIEKTKPALATNEHTNS